MAIETMIGTNHFSDAEHQDFGIYYSLVYLKVELAKAGLTRTYEIIEQALEKIRCESTEVSKRSDESLQNTNDFLEAVFNADKLKLEGFFESTNPKEDL